jgi:hypothetical protein
MARHVKDLADLIPPDPQRLEHLFQTALRGRALETGPALGLEEAAKEVEQRRLADASPLTPPAPAAPATVAAPRPERMEPERLALKRAAPAEKAEEDAGEEALADAELTKDKAAPDAFFARDGGVWDPLNFR